VLPNLKILAPKGDSVSSNAQVNKYHFNVDKVYTVGYGESAFAKLRRDRAGTDSGFRSLECTYLVLCIGISDWRLPIADLQGVL